MSRSSVKSEVKVTSNINNTVLIRTVNYFVIWCSTCVNMTAIIIVIFVVVVDKPLLYTQTKQKKYGNYYIL
jgi:hypothetical protein